MEGLTVGRIVRWVADHRLSGECGHPLAAIVIKVRDPERGLVDLQAFMTTCNATFLTQNVSFSPDHELGTWDWVEQA